MNTLFPNINPIPQMPVSVEEHHRTLKISIIVGSAAIILGMLYWWSAINSQKTTVVTTSKPQSIEEIMQASLIEKSKTYVSQEQAAAVAAQLAAKSKTVVSAEQKLAVENALLSK